MAQYTVLDLRSAMTATGNRFIEAVTVETRPIPSPLLAVYAANTTPAVQNYAQKGVVPTTGPPLSKVTGKFIVNYTVPGRLDAVGPTRTERGQRGREQEV